MQFKETPDMNPASVIQDRHWRIGVITESLIRLEWSDDGNFEDLPTQVVINRDFGDTPNFTVERYGNGVVVDTPALRLTYDGQVFSKQGLSAYIKGMPDVKTNTWHYSDSQDGNLLGTARTLDWADGPIALSPGIISRDGWAILDDSNSLTINNDKTTPENNITLPEQRSHTQVDLYLFGYGHHYSDAVRDFQKLSGRMPLLPRYALGNWWSRFHRYSDSEYLSLIDHFAAEHIPFTIAVLDMDWHITDPDPRYGSGWTGYTWNRDLFPSPENFLKSLHDRGYHVTLNVHPRDGVRAFEDAYPKVAAAMGIDQSSEKPVEFDPTSSRFVDAYLDMHHDLEAEGVDFWWLDWQQGGVTRQPGLDPLWVLNHLHYLDSGRDGRWPLILSRYAGPGSQRYPVGFSGDTVVTWESLKFQPYFTATASNIGYGWWSHDIGGHMFGYRDEELEARWYQLGAFSPINRLHSTCSPFSGKEPWNYHADVQKATTIALRLRHALLPYLHTMNWRANLLGEPLVRPMYWDNSETDAAYSIPDEYHFGTELVVSPIVEPADTDSHRGKATTWLPQGLWFDFFDGRHYRSLPSNGRIIDIWRTIDRIPVFAKAGAIVPLQSCDNNDTTNPETLRLLVYPGMANTFTLFEDNGVYEDVQDGEHSPGLCRTTFDWEWSKHRARFTILPAEGNTSAIPACREWNITFRGTCLRKVHAVSFIPGSKPREIQCSIEYDSSTLSMNVQIPATEVNHVIEIDLPDGLPVSGNPTHDDAFRILYDANMPYLTKEKAFDAIKQTGVAALSQFGALEHVSGDDPTDCSDSHMPEGVRQALTEVLLRDCVTALDQDVQ